MAGEAGRAACIVLACLALAIMTSAVPQSKTEAENIAKIKAMNVDQLLAKEKEEETGLKSDMERLSSVTGMSMSDLGFGDLEGQSAPAVDLHEAPQTRPAPTAARAISPSSAASTGETQAEKTARLSREADELLGEEKSEESGIASDLAQLNKIGGGEFTKMLGLDDPTDVSLAENAGSGGSNVTEDAASRGTEVANLPDSNTPVVKDVKQDGPRVGPGSKWVPYHPNYDLSRPGSRARAEANAGILAAQSSSSATNNKPQCVATLPTDILRELAGDGTDGCSSWCKSVAARGVLDTMNLSKEGVQGLLKESTSTASLPAAATALLELESEETLATATGQAGSAGCLTRPHKMIRRRVAEKRHRMEKASHGSENTVDDLYADPGAVTMALQVGSATSAPSSWSYDNAAEWGSLDKSFGMCNLGAHQSPIDVNTNELVEDKDLPAVEPSFQSGRLQLSKDGASSGKLVGVSDGSGGVKYGGRMYNLESVRVHWPSEHHIEGASVDLEIQLICRVSGDDIAIMSFLFRTGAFNDGVDPLVNGFSEGKSSIEWNPATLFEAMDTPDYIYYDGSMSFPPCQENVHYIILSEMMPIAEGQLKKLRDMLNQKPNNRPIMNLGTIRHVICRDIALTKANLLKDVSQDAASGVEEAFADEISGMSQIVNDSSMGDGEKKPMLDDINNFEDEIQNNESDSSDSFAEAADVREGYLNSLHDKAAGASDKSVKPRIDPHIASLLAMNKPGACGIKEGDRPDSLSKVIDLSDRLEKKNKDHSDERVRNLVKQLPDAKTLSCGFYQARDEIKKGMNDHASDPRAQSGDTAKFGRMLDGTENAVNVSGPETDKAVSTMDKIIDGDGVFIGGKGTDSDLQAKSWMDVMKNTRSAPARWRSLLDEIISLTGDDETDDGTKDGGKKDGVDAIADAFLNGDGNGKHPLNNLANHLLSEGDEEDAKALEGLADQMRTAEANGRSDRSLNNKGKEEGAGGDPDDGGNNDEVDRELTAEELQAKVDAIIAKAKADGHELTEEELEDLEAMAQGLPGRPGKPKLLEASPKKVHIKWEGPNPDFSLPSAGYQILMNNKTKETVGKDTMEYLLDDIKPEGWMIQVRAVNKKGKPGKPSAGITMNVLKPEFKKARRALDRATRAIGEMPEAKRRKFRPLLHKLNKGLMSQDPDELRNAMGLMDRKKPDFVDPELMPIIDDVVGAIQQLEPLPPPSPRKRPKKTKTKRPRRAKKRRPRPQKPRVPPNVARDMDKLNPKNAKATCESAKKMKEDMMASNGVKSPDHVNAELDKLIARACGIADAALKPADPEEVAQAVKDIEAPLEDLKKKLKKPPPAPLKDWADEVNQVLNSPLDPPALLNALKPLIANKPQVPGEDIEDPECLSTSLNDIDGAMDAMEDGLKAGNPKMLGPALDGLRKNIPNAMECGRQKLPDEIAKPLEAMKAPTSTDEPPAELCHSADELSEAEDPAVDAVRKELIAVQDACQRAKDAARPGEPDPEDLDDLEKQVEQLKKNVKPNDVPATAIPVPPQEVNPDPDGLDPPPIHLVGNGKDWIEVYYEPVPRADKYELYVDGKVVYTGPKAGEEDGVYRLKDCDLEVIYHFKVRALNDKHKSVFNFLDAIIGKPPGDTPAGLEPPKLHQVGEHVVESAGKKEGVIEVGWSEVANATDYILAVDGKVVYTGMDVSYTLEHAVLHQTYRFRIQAIDEVRDLKSSYDFLDADVGDMTNPEPPRRPDPPYLVEHRPTMFAVTWDPVEGAETYDLSMRGAGPGMDAHKDPTDVYTGPVNDYVRENVRPEQRFIFTVRAISPEGLKSEYSEPLLVTSAELSEEAVILSRNDTMTSDGLSLVAFDVTKTTISLRWNMVAATEGYEVIMDGEVIDVKLSNEDVTSNATDLSCDTTYTFSVGGYTAKNPRLVWSHDVQATTLKCDGLDDYLAGFPVEPSLDRLDEQFMLEWLRENSGDECSAQCISDTADTVMDKLGVDRAPAWEFKAQVYPKRSWSYANPGAWGGKCATGSRQSPVNIDGVNGGLVHYSNLQNFETYYWNNENTEIVKSDVLLRIKYRAGSYITMPQFGAVKFNLKEIHVHSPGEHMINGRVGEIEIQLVHISESGTVVIVAVQGVEGRYHPSMAFVEFLPERQGLLKTDVKLNAADLLPVDPNYYMYEGSLTSPPCAEGVYWAVMAKPMEFSRDQLDALIAAVPKNNRPLQPLYNRMILSSRLHRTHHKMELADKDRSYASNSK